MQNRKGARAAPDASRGSTFYSGFLFFSFFFGEEEAGGGGGGRIGKSYAFPGDETPALLLTEGTDFDRRK